MNENLPLDKQAQNNGNIPLDKAEAPAIEGDTRKYNQDDIYLATGLDDVDMAEAKSHVAQNAGLVVQGIIDEAFGVQRDPAQLTGQINNEQSKVGSFLETPDFYYEQALATRKPDVSEADVRLATNERIAYELLAELRAQESAGDGVTDVVLDFGAFILRESTVGIVENLTDRTERRGTEILWHKINDTPSEFKAYMQNLVEESRAESLRNDSIWSVMQLEDEVYSAGYDKDKNIKKAFALIDLVGAGEIAGAGLKLARGAAKSTTKVGKVAAMDGIQEASETAVNTVKSRIDPEVATDALPGSLNPHKQSVSASEGWYARAMQENALVKRIDNLYKSGAMGKVVDDAVVEAKITSKIDEFAAKVGAPIVRSELKALELGRAQLVMQFGKQSGLPYKRLSAAENLAAKVPGSKAVPVDKDDLAKGYVVEKAENVNKLEMVEAINPDELLAMEGGILRSTAGKFFGGEIMGSSATRGVERLTALSQMGEASTAAIKREFKQAAKPIESVSLQQRADINAIVGRLRDDPAEAARRSWYSEEEFKNLYKEYTGQAADQKVVDAYNATVEISDAAGVIKANNLFRRYLDLDYKTLEVMDGVRAPAKTVQASKLSADDLVFDGEMGATFRFSNLDEGYGEIYKLDKPVMDGVEYVVKPKGIRELDPVDVMGYNAGGSRLNPDANFFVTMAGTRLKALLTAFSEAEAKVAAEQINNIRSAWRSGTLTDDVLRANNKWNPELETVGELEEFMKSHKWDLSKEGDIAYKNRDGDLIQSADVADDAASMGMRVDEYIDNDMRRMDTVLPNFGGGKAVNLDPVSAIGQQFESASMEFAHHAYTHNAMIGWVKEAQRRGRSWFRGDIPPTDYRNLFRTAEITGDDAFARRMREIHAIESRRMGVKSKATQAMDSMGKQVSEFVFDKFGAKTKLGDPSNQLLTVGYQSAFGFMNVSQVFIQASHAMTIMAASPVHGSKAAGLALITRSLTNATTEAVDEAAKRMSKYYGMSVDDTKEIMEFVRTSGRDIVDGDAVEMGTGVGYGISGFGGESYNPSVLQKAWYSTKKAGSAALDVGLMPFNAGERLARRTGILTAILEFKAKNPGIPLNSDMARRWITTREQNLTFNMTTGSRPAIQSGVMRVPTQWLSHTFRAMETVFVGRGFTKAERARMFAAMVPMYGLAGFGAASAAGYLGEKLGMSEDSAMFTTLKWGLIDGLTDWLMPDTVGKQGTGLAPRLTPVGAVLETYRNITEGNFMEVAMGPSGGIASDIYGAASRSFSSLIHGRDVMLTEDILRVIRQPSGVDNVAKAYGIFNNGVYRSKNGVTIPGEMSPTDGIMTLFGVTTLKQTEWYNAKNEMFRSSKKFTDYRKEINREAEVAFAYLKDDETRDRGIEMIDELHAKITLSGFAPQQVAQLRKAIRTQLEDEWVTLQDSLLQQQRIYDQQRLGKVLGRFE